MKFHDHTNIGHDYIWKTTFRGKNEEKQSKTLFWYHFYYDFSTFCLSTTFTILGVYNIDTLTNRMMFVLISMHWFGLILKTTFYAYMHPWVKLNETKNIHNCQGITFAFNGSFWLHVYTSQLVIVY